MSSLDFDLSTDKYAEPEALEYCMQVDETTRRNRFFKVRIFCVIENCYIYNLYSWLNPVMSYEVMWLLSDTVGSLSTLHHL